MDESFAPIKGKQTANVSRRNANRLECFYSKFIMESWHTRKTNFQQEFLLLFYGSVCVTGIILRRMFRVFRVFFFLSIPFQGTTITHMVCAAWRWEICEQWVYACSLKKTKMFFFKYTFTNIFGGEEMPHFLLGCVHYTFNFHALRIYIDATNRSILQSNHCHQWVLMTRTAGLVLALLKSFFFIVGIEGFSGFDLLQDLYQMIQRSCLLSGLLKSYIYIRF